MGNCNDVQEQPARSRTMEKNKNRAQIFSDDDDDNVDLSKTLPKPKTDALIAKQKKGDDGDTSGEEKFDDDFESNDGFVLKKQVTKNLLDNNLIVAQRYMYGRGSEKAMKPK